jgi:hypothetical protein
MVWDADNAWEDDPDFRDERESPIRKRGVVMRTPETRQTKTWNGVPVKSMESSHIMNSILYCERKYIEGWSNHKGCHGDKEDFYFLSVYEMFPEYINLRDEWKRRLE